MMISHTFKGITYYTDISDIKRMVSESRVEKFLSNLHLIELGMVYSFVSAGGKLLIKAPGTDDGGSFGVVKDGGKEVPIITLTMYMGVESSGTFYHEYVHYEQYLRGDLAFQFNQKGETTQMLWKGEKADAFDATDLRDYLNQPWEYEAHERSYNYLYTTGQSVKSPKVAMSHRAMSLRACSIAERLGKKLFSR